MGGSLNSMDIKWIANFEYEVISAPMASKHIEFVQPPLSITKSVGVGIDRFEEIRSFGKMDVL